jgi:hypothetical protein
MGNSIITDLYTLIGQLYYEKRLLSQHNDELEREIEELKRGGEDNGTVTNTARTEDS